MTFKICKPLRGLGDELFLLACLQKGRRAGLAEWHAAGHRARGELVAVPAAAEAAKGGCGLAVGQARRVHLLTADPSQIRLHRLQCMEGLHRGFVPPAHLVHRGFRLQPSGG